MVLSAIKDFFVSTKILFYHSNIVHFLLYYIPVRCFSVCVFWYRQPPSTEQRVQGAFPTILYLQNIPFSVNFRNRLLSFYRFRLYLYLCLYLCLCQCRIWWSLKGDFQHESILMYWRGSIGISTVQADSFHTVWLAIGNRIYQPAFVRLNNVYLFWQTCHLYVLCSCICVFLSTVTEPCFPISSVTIMGIGNSGRERCGSLAFLCGVNRYREKQDRHKAQCADSCQ